MKKLLGTIALVALLISLPTKESQPVAGMNPDCPCCTPHCWIDDGVKYCQDSQCFIEEIIR